MVILGMGTAWPSQLFFFAQSVMMLVQVKYNLFGVIVYRSMGSNGGHYFAFVKTGRGPKEQWYLADDDDTRSVCWPEVLREEPFMLLSHAQLLLSSFVQMLHDSFCSECSIYLPSLYAYTWNDDEDDDWTMIDNFELRDTTNQFSRWSRVIKGVNIMKHMPSITHHQ